VPVESPGWASVAGKRVRVADGIDLVVDFSRGSAPGIVCIPGLASNARLFDGLATVLCDLGYAVATLDLRGHGRSSKPDEGYDFPTLCADVLQVIGALEAEEGGSCFGRPLLAGQSFGANLALELAVRAPEAVTGAICIDGGVIELSESFATREEMVAALTPPRLGGMELDALRAALEARHPDWPRLGIEGMLANFAVAADGTVTPALSLEHHLAILDALWSEHPSALFTRAGVPVLLLPASSAVTEESPKHTQIERALAALPRGRVQWFSPADHDVHAQQPAAVAGAIDHAIKDGFFS